jgi:putative aldouronate transport system permease protein
VTALRVTSGIKRFTWFDAANYCVMVVFCLLIVYPLWYTLVHSFNEGNDTVLRGPVYLVPRVPTLENYVAVFENQEIVTAFGVSAARTAFATVAHVFFTAMVAYAFTKKKLMGRRIWLLMGTITLFFSGGLIPTYLLVRQLGLIDSFFVYILVPMFSFFHCIIFMNFFRTIPDSLEESAQIDGAHEFWVFTHVIVPLSKPVLATIALFNGVFNWNDYFYGVIYINRQTWLLPIQTFLYRVVASSQANTMMNLYSQGVVRVSVTPESIRMATMMVTTLPVICAYPFLQRYFTTGMLLGSIKG